LPEAKFAGSVMVVVAMLPLTLAFAVKVSMVKVTEPSLTVPPLVFHSYGRAGVARSGGVEWRTLQEDIRLTACGFLTFEIRRELGYLSVLSLS
jgi:hypothetical protein